MTENLVDYQISSLIRLFSHLPGLGPRSARRIVLSLLCNRETILLPLVQSMVHLAENVISCEICGNISTTHRCSVCTDKTRDTSIICVVETIADMWALDRSSAFRGYYHILGGVLSALDGIGPEELNFSKLIERCAHPQVKEVILALNATVDSQTTVFTLSDMLQTCQVSVSVLAKGMPIGSELDYLDSGTIATALLARQPLISLQKQ
jgi:recombination protein RecR